ncbi:MAG: hypothetical protein U9N34_02765 [Candidatus Cloacimonadota bacterium]|nr:hypothetical protein [Candidatus Cloacimonadota bacterium]
MKKMFIVILLMSSSFIFAQNTQKNEENIDIIETESNPMRPDFGGNLKKRPIKKIKIKNKIVKRNLLNSNKLLYKNDSRRNYEKRN